MKTLNDVKAGDTVYLWCGRIERARRYRAVPVIRTTKTKIIVQDRSKEVAYGRKHGQELPKISGYNYSGLCVNLPEGK